MAADLLKKESSVRNSSVEDISEESSWRLSLHRSKHWGRVRRRAGGEGDRAEVDDESLEIFVIVTHKDRLGDRRRRREGLELDWWWREIERKSEVRRWLEWGLGRERDDGDWRLDEWWAGSELRRGGRRVDGWLLVCFQITRVLRRQSLGDHTAAEMDAVGVQDQAPIQDFSFLREAAQ
jgi:hypothetical protein